MTRTRQTIYIEVVAEEITIIEVSGVVDLIINIIYYYYPLNKRSVIYIGNLDVG